MNVRYIDSNIVMYYIGNSVMVHTESSDHKWDSRDGKLLDAEELLERRGLLDLVGESVQYIIFMY